MTDQDDRSSGIEILIADALAKIKPTDPSILVKQESKLIRFLWYLIRKSRGFTVCVEKQ